MDAEAETIRRANMHLAIDAEPDVQHLECIKLSIQKQVLSRRKRNKRAKLKRTQAEAVT